MKYTDLLKNIWNLIYDQKNDAVEIVKKYFAPNYEQCINGVCMNRDEYIVHILEQKKNMTIESIDYKYVLEKGNELFAIYNPKGKNKSNLPIEAEVIAYFYFTDNKLSKIHGQVRLIQGNYSDVDMQKD